MERMAVAVVKDFIFAGGFEVCCWLALEGLNGHKGNRIGNKTGRKRSFDVLSECCCC